MTADAGLLRRRKLRQGVGQVVDATELGNRDRRHPRPQLHGQPGDEPHGGGV
jgi:hypothetical protein